MIGKISKGTGFLGVLIYVMNEKKGHYIDSNLNAFNGVKPEILARQLAQNNDLNSRVKKTVFHVSIALEKDAKIDDATFKTIGDRYMKEFGFNVEKDPDNMEKGVTPYVMVRHTDTPHPHIHIVANRIDSAGYCNNPGNDYKLSNDICRKLEKEYGLQIVSAIGPGVKDMKREERRMRERFKAEGKRIPNHRKYIISKIDPLTKPIGGGKRPFKSFVSELKKQGIDVNLNTDKAKTRVNGISFSMKGKEGPIKYKGSALGKNYTWKALSEKLEFDIKKDLVLLANTNSIKVNAGVIDSNVDATNTMQPGTNDINLGGKPDKLAQKGSGGDYQEESNNELEKNKKKQKQKRRNRL